MLLVVSVLGFVACGSSGDSEDMSPSGNLTAVNLTDDGYYDGMLYYQITSNSPQEVSITKANQSVQTVNTPASVVIEGNQYKCTGIGDGAFANCKNLVSLTISDNILSIGDVAFRGCTKLASVVLPKQLSKINHYAFDGCTSLTSIVIPENVTAIEEGAFQDCKSLANITISNSSTFVYPEAFQGCKSLISLSFHGIFIGDRAFRDCSSLQNVDIEYPVFCIGEEAFANCGISTINIKYATFIGQNALSGCKWLKSVHIKRTPPRLFSYLTYSLDSFESNAFESGTYSYDARQTTGGGYATIGNGYTFSYKSWVMEQSVIADNATSSNAILYVSKDYIDEYKSSDWRIFSQIVEE